MRTSIRPAIVADIDAMYAISCSVHLSPRYKAFIPISHYEKFQRVYTPDAIRRARYHDKISRRLADPHWQVWVAVRGKAICGFTMRCDTRTASELRGLFVMEKYQGQGIGNQLFTTSIEAHEGRQLVLEVISHNVAAKRMYEKAGFKIASTEVGTFYGASLTRMVMY